MKRIFCPAMAAVLAVSALFSGGTTHAVRIAYELTDVANVYPDRDLWQCVYTVSDHSFGDRDGFTIYFEYGLYEEILIPDSEAGDWDLIAWDPEPIFDVPDDGGYDALALTDEASLADPFVVDFTWTGDGRPGPQAFDVYDAENNYETHTTERGLGELSLGDAIRCLRVLTGISGDISSETDVTGDGKTGLEDAVRILQAVAGT